MRADAGFPPRRAPGWPLAATLGAHLLLAWWWLDATAVRVLPSFGPALREFLVVPALLPPVTAPAPSAPPEAARHAPPSLPRAPVRKPVEAQAITALPAEAPAAQSDPAAVSSIEAAPASEEQSLAGRARREAGRADHALRKGKLAPLEPSDTPWTRFVAGIEGAHNDTSRTVTSESYTSPDGVTIYRFRKNGKYYCRSGGDVRPSMFGAEGGRAQLFDKAGGGGFAGLVACPSNTEFKRD